jgi:two-component system response regulator AtoC
MKRPDLNFTNFHGFLTVSPQMEQLFVKMKRVARTNASVLVRGQSGTGKELVSHAIHMRSPRSRKPFRAINCATLTGELLASELFGHVRGAFTGAVKDRSGIFALANGGTIFLDEIAEIPLTLQGRLLRVLQERTYIPVGGTEPKNADVRVISATHRALRKEVDERRFREDLMYRVRVAVIYLPRLVEREGDIEALTWHFINEFNKDGFRYIDAIHPHAFDAMMEHSWPGNIRELRNNIEQAFAMGEGPVLHLSDLTPELQGIGTFDDRTEAPMTEQQLERDRLVAALRNAKGRKGDAADELGMSRSTLWRKLKVHGISR